MKILLAASEVSPLARTGDFADAVSHLSSHLVKAGNDVTLILPYYRCIRENKTLKPRRTKPAISVELGSARLECTVWEAVGPNGVNLLLVERDEFFDRTGLYGVEDRDYQDNAARFIFFSKVVVEMVRRQAPDVVQVVGWQPALVPAFLRAQHLNVRSVLSPYSLEYQGNFWSHDFQLTNLPGNYFSSDSLEFYGSMNFLKAGIVYADAVVLPGGRHVAAMQTSDHGCGLENVLREHSYKLEGIAPGLNESVFPSVRSSDQSIKKARAALFPNIDQTASARIVVVDAASTAGAGIDLLLSVMDRLPSDDLKIILLGAVDATRREALVVATRRHADRFVHLPQLGAPELEQVLLAGDFHLIPGPIEPGSHFLALAMRNGIVPLAENCSGLHQTLRDFDPVTGCGNALIFYRHSEAALSDVLRRAAFLGSEELKNLSSRAVETDFSWNGTVLRLETLYKRLLDGRISKAA